MAMMVRTRWTTAGYDPKEKLCKMLFRQNIALFFWIIVVMMSSAVVVLGDSSNDVSQNKNEKDEDLLNDSSKHPDLNEENHEGMIYVGRICHETGRRLSADHDNTVRYVFGTAFDDSHKSMELTDLQHQRTGPDVHHDLPSKSRQQVLQERRHKNLTQAGPVPFGHVDTNALDGGVTPVRAVAVQPFWLDASPVTNQQFAKFVRATLYETEAEKFGWSFVLSSFIGSEPPSQGSLETDPDAPHWVAVPGAHWRQPEGPRSSYRHREHHPVVHVSHRDAAEYCRWRNRGRLPGEREWEAAARGPGQWSRHDAPETAVRNRTVYAWGDDDDWDTANRHANLWGGTGAFPDKNDAADGWRGTSPVKHYPPNAAGFYDMTGNVWEWMRGGKNRARIVRGASYVDSLDGSFNHAATLGARAVLHGTTTAGNVGFRCAKAVSKRIEHHWTWHNEDEHGVLAVEDQFGKRDVIPQKGWEDQYSSDDDDEEADDDDEDAPPPKRKKKKVVLKRETLSTEL